VRSAGSYSVNPDRTGTLTLKTALNRNVDYDFVLVNNNTELFITGSDQSEATYGSALRQ
jgi:hypothetical protein